MHNVGFVATATRKSTNSVVTIPLGTFLLSKDRVDGWANTLAGGLQKEFWGDWEIRIFSTEEKNYLKTLDKLGI